VGLLVLGVAGGLYLGHDGGVQQRSAEAQLVVASDTTEVQLLRQRQNAHAAARAWQRQAESDAAARAAAAAKAAASKARALEKKAIAKRAAEKVAAAANKAAESRKSVPYSGPVPSSCKEYSGNREIGCSLMIKDGFGIDQFPCLDKLWTKESHWNTKASNSGSGAYGIPQALPGSKMGSEGSDWRTNPATQIEWGLGYIRDRYGSPCGAWGFKQSHGWY